MSRGRRSTPLAAAVAAVALGLALSAAAACGGGERGPVRSPRPRAHDGPIVLVTIDALRADAVGALGGPAGLTPHLDALAAESHWVARAVSSSSWTVPAMASLVTGLSPWRHQNWGGNYSVLRPELETLAEALAARGYATQGFHSNHWLSERYGHDQGFQAFRALKEGKRAAAELAALGPGRSFVWAHILPPHAPYVRRALVAKQVPARLVPPTTPDRLSPRDLEPWFDPERPLPEATRREAWALYLHNVAYADLRAGQLLSALRRSGQWDRALVVVTSDHGEEFGEHGQVLHGGNLGRVLLEVPLLIKLPRDAAPPPAASVGPIATSRLFATLVEAAGGVPGEGAAPSLWRAGDWPPLSELYAGNGVNLFSLLDGDRQVVWTARFAPAEPEYYRARLAELGGRLDRPLAEPAAGIFRRLDEAFPKAPPLTGDRATPPIFASFRWAAGGGVEALDDPAALEAAARRLRAAWRERNGEETLPRRAGGLPPGLSAEEIEKLRALGYIGGGGDGN